VPSTATFARLAAVSIRQLLGRRHDRFLRLQDGLDLRRDRLQRRTGTEQDDVRCGRLESGPQIGLDLHPQLPAEADDVAQVVTCLGGVDIDGADDRETTSPGNLPDDARADRPESNVQHANRHEGAP
jgi:hypothetical protein